MYKYKSLQACQLPQGYLSFLVNLLNFIITKYLKQWVDDNLIVSMNECSPCGLFNWRYKDLSMSHDQKVMTLLPPMKKCAIDFYQLSELLLLPKYYNSSPSVTWDKEICHIIMS